MKKTLLLFAMLLSVVGAWAAVTKPVSGVYVISGDNPAGKRGKLAAVEGITAHPALSNITWNDNQGNYVGNSATPITNGEHWYVYQVGDKYVIYNLGLKKYLFNPKDGSKIDFSDTPYLWDILVNSSNGNFNSIWDATGTYLCFACGKTAANRNVHFNNQSGDGGSLHTFTAVENGETTYAEDIAVVVSKMNPTFTLTDIAGNEYTGTYSGIAGVDEPTFTGVANITISNKKWNGDNFTADITFPFPVSSETVVNPTLIVNGASWGSPNSRKWRAVSVTESETTTYYVKVQTAAVNQNNVDALWAIYPSLNEGKFTVMIKNLKTNTFVKANPEAVGDSGEGKDVTGATKPVSLAEEGTAFEYKLRTGSNYHFTYVNTGGTELRLSMNGSGDTDEFLGVYNGSHSGNDVAFPDYVGNMTFPISVSSSTSTNAKMISAFKEGYSGNHGNFQYGFKWYSSGNSVKMKRMHSASVTNLDDFSWAIYPMPVGENMCYAIKNIKTGKYVYTTAKFTAQNNDNGDHSGDEVELSENPMYFRLNTSNGAFYYYPSGSEITHYLSCNSTTSANEQFLGVWTSNHNGTKNEFLPLSFKVEVSDLGYATLYSPISVKQTTYTGGDITPSVEVYSISEEPASGYVTLSSMEGGIPANQGAILENAGTYYFTQDNNVSGDAWSGNLLEGSAVDTYVAGPAYVLANGDNGVGLYKAELNMNEAGVKVGKETGTHFKNNAGKAYLPDPAGAGARFLVFSFGDDMETGITETENGLVKTENTVVYDLAGRRVQGAQKGIFIVNGKKVVR